MYRKLFKVGSGSIYYGDKWHDVNQFTITYTFKGVKTWVGVITTSIDYTLKTVIPGIVHPKEGKILVRVNGSEEEYELLGVDSMKSFHSTQQVLGDRGHITAVHHTEVTIKYKDSREVCADLFEGELEFYV